MQSWGEKIGPCTLNKYMSCGQPSVAVRIKPVYELVHTLLSSMGRACYAMGARWGSGRVSPLEQEASKSEIDFP